MLLTLGIIFILLVAIYSGAKRGLILQLVMTVGYMFSFWFALNYYEAIREPLEMIVPYPPVSLSDTFILFTPEMSMALDTVYYNGIAFLAILAIGWIITRLLGGLLQFVAELPLLKQANVIGGAILNFIVNYVGVFLVLFVLSTVPLDFIQGQFDSSSLAQNIVANTPKLSDRIFEWWSTEF